MYPFSYNEFLDFKQQSSDESFNEYVEYGGFPQVFSLNNEDKLKYLHDLFNSYGRNLKNISRTIENIVYIELLRKGYEVTIGKIGDFEIDFIARKHKQKVYIQVTYSLASEETFDREFRPLLKVNDNYPKYIISTDKFDLSQDGVIHQNLIDFLVSGSYFSEVINDLEDKGFNGGTKI